VLESIIAEIDVEISRLKQVRALLANDGPKRGRPARVVSVSPPIRPPAGRVLSPETRERMRSAIAHENCRSAELRGESSMQVFRGL
jgi:hypothetical protein